MAYDSYFTFNLLLRKRMTNIDLINPTIVKPMQHVPPESKIITWPFVTRFIDLQCPIGTYLCLSQARRWQPDTGSYKPEMVWGGSGFGKSFEILIWWKNKIWNDWQSRSHEMFAVSSVVEEIISRRFGTEYIRYVSIYL